MLNETHDPGRRSWVDSAQKGDFPIQNLPLGVFRRRGEGWRIGVAIGDEILDLWLARRAGALRVLGGQILDACAAPELNALMALGPAAWSRLRAALSGALRAGSPHAGPLRACLVPQSQVEYALPVRIADYTDFYTSIHHATAVGRLFRPDNPLLPNYRWIPVGYHGRSSSIGVSGQAFPRPQGQIMGDQAPRLGPSCCVDYELELGIFIGTGNAQGVPVPIDEAEDHVFGVCLLNDWSARDIQAWEYQPLGPFLSKNFATTLSPWVVTLEALAPFRRPCERAPEDPAPLPYLDSQRNRERGAIDIRMEVALQSARMRAEGVAPVPLARTSFRHAYWSIAQLVAHHTVNGCNLRTGDLFGSGTQSGPAPEEAGSLLELSAGGQRPVALPGGETRGFLEDDDTVVLRAWCEAPGAVRIGFGEAAGTVLPART